MAVNNITNKDINNFKKTIFFEKLSYYKKKVLCKFFKFNNVDKIKRKKIHSINEGNEIIKKIISESERPFLISRFGGVENDIVSKYFLFKINKIKEIPNDTFTSAKINAGMFSNNLEGFETFVKYIKNSISQMDACGYWNLDYTNIIYRTFYNKKLKYFDFAALEPISFSHPWTYALKGKKILVVSSFAKTIEEQYKNRKYLFKNPEILPEFTLLTYTPVISSGDNIVPFKTWEEALLKMRDDISKLDFDIALISCGSYGMPLGGLLKEAGKSCIHVGGCLQLLFGIKGKRWDTSIGPKFYNQHWIKSEENKPKNSDKIENSCYW